MIVCIVVKEMMIMLEVSCFALLSFIMHMLSANHQNILLGGMGT